jgi:putative thioredoxin
MSDTSYIIDVNEQNFVAQVIEASHQQPVMVDFWATWCGPCQTLIPLLEQLAAEYDGGFILAKVDVDQNQQLASQFGVRSVPTVKIVKDGQIVDEFTGVIPDTEVRAKLDQHISNESNNKLDEANALYAQGETEQAITIMQQVILDEPNNHPARIIFANLLVNEKRYDDARQLIDSLPDEEKNKAEVRALIAQMEMSNALRDAPSIDDLQQRIAKDETDSDARYLLGNQLIATGDYENAMEQFLQLMIRDREFNDDAGRKSLLQVFDMLGGSGELVTKYRRKMANALN